MVCSEGEVTHSSTSVPTSVDSCVIDTALRKCARVSASALCPRARSCEGGTEGCAMWCYIMGRNVVLWEMRIARQTSDRISLNFCPCVAAAWQAQEQDRASFFSFTG